MWTDLTVEDAEQVRDFYEAVMGWTFQPVEMGGYSDFTALDSEGNVVGGICHARGPNIGLPSVWLVYRSVPDLDAALEVARSRGGEVLHGPRDMGSYGVMAVIRDPAGASLALMGPPAEPA